MQLTRTASLLQRNKFPLLPKPYWCRNSAWKHSPPVFASLPWLIPYLFSSAEYKSDTQKRIYFYNFQVIADNDDMQIREFYIIFKSTYDTSISNS